MLRELLTAYRKGRDFDELEALCVRLVEDNDRLRLRLAQSQQEVRRLRRRVNDLELRTLRRAEVDASLMACLWLAGLPTSRRACAEVGIPRRRWSWARALMMVAHVLDEGGDWLVDDATTFDARINTGVRLVEAQGMERVRARLPLNGNAGRRFPRPAGHAAGHADGHTNRAKMAHYSGRRTN